MRSCYSMDRFVQAKRKQGLPLIHEFLNKHVRIKVSEGLEVEGVLIRYQMQNKTEHKPSLLILKNREGFHIIRGSWISISEVKG